MAQYNQLQTIVAHAMLSNLSALRSGTAVDLTADLDQTLHTLFHRDDMRDLIGVWDAVWGPVVAQVRHSHQADNTLYVANKRGTTEYVISVAGTNPFSWYDWFNQDFAVGETIRWSFYRGDELDPRLSQGTQTGLDVLVAMTSRDTPLLTFLQQMVAARASTVQIAVTGHSLGGALSPALALYLFDTQDEWNPDQKATLSVYPTAGPTSGTRDWATYYDGRLGEQTTRIWNTLDVVPHAWDHQLLDQVADLYAPEINADALVRKVIAKAQKASAPHTYGQIQPDAPGLQGQVHLGTPLEKAIIEGLDFLQLDFLNFLDQVTYQHVEAYLHLLGVSELDEIIEIKLLNSLTFDLFQRSREKAEALWHQVLSALGVAATD